MIRMFQCLAMGFLAAVWVACGSGGSTGKADPASASASGEVETPAEDAAAATPTLSTETYRSQHDPDAFYTRDTFPLTGSYLKVEMDDLTPDQFDRVIHRLKCEKSTCGSGYTIDECLVNRPQCWVAVELLKQVVREEKLRG
jgi:hypothetical protein